MVRTSTSPDPDDGIKSECEEIQRLLDRLNSGMQAIATMPPDQQATDQGAASHQEQFNLYRTYEARVLRLQQLHAPTIESLAAKGAALAKLIEPMNAPADSRLLEAVLAYLADVHRLATKPYLVWERPVTLDDEISEPGRQD